MAPRFKHFKIILQKLYIKSEYLGKNYLSRAATNENHSLIQSLESLQEEMYFLSTVIRVRTPPLMESFLEDKIVLEEQYPFVFLINMRLSLLFQTRIP